MMMMMMVMMMMMMCDCDAGRMTVRRLGRSTSNSVVLHTSTTLTSKWRQIRLPTYLTSTTPTSNWWLSRRLGYRLTQWL